ncbi:unnamed protein product [Brassica oleracea var. botrytis]
MLNKRCRKPVILHGRRGHGELFCCMFLEVRLYVFLVYLHRIWSRSEWVKARRLIIDHMERKVDH